MTFSYKVKGTQIITKDDWGNNLEENINLADWIKSVPTKYVQIKYKLNNELYITSFEQLNLAKLIKLNDLSFVQLIYGFRYKGKKGWKQCRNITKRYHQYYFSGIINKNHLKPFIFDPHNGYYVT